MHKVALLALVPRLRTVSSLQETTEEREMFTGETACLTRKNNLFLNARKQKKSKLSLSYMVHRIFWSESHRLAGWQTHSNITTTEVGSSSLQHITIEAGFPVGKPASIVICVLSRGSLSICGCGSDGVVCAELWPQFGGCAHE